MEKTSADLPNIVDDLKKIIAGARQIHNEIATLLKDQYDALIRVGFSEKEAIKIIISLSQEEELHGWAAMADFLDISIPTMIKLAKEQMAPVTLISGTPYSTTEKLKKWKEEKLKHYPYWKKIN